MKLIIILLNIILMTACVGYMSKFSENGKAEFQTKITKNEVIESRGKPDKIEKLQGNREIYTYINKETDWHGIFISLLVIPIPLLFPTHNSQEIIFNENVIEYTNIETTKINSFFCGYILYTDHGAGFSCEIE